MGPGCEIFCDVRRLCGIRQINQFGVVARARQPNVNLVAAKVGQRRPICISGWSRPRQFRDVRGAGTVTNRRIYACGTVTSRRIYAYATAAA